MEFLVTKANNDYWYKFEKYDTINELMKNMEKRHSELVLQENFWYQDNPEEFVVYWEGKMSLEDAIKVSKLKYAITIYNDYLE